MASRISESLFRGSSLDIPKSTAGEECCNDGAGLLSI
jgi:hypothetical protein